MKEKTPTRLDMPGYDPREFVGYGRNPSRPHWLIERGSGES